MRAADRRRGKTGEQTTSVDQLRGDQPQPEVLMLSDLTHDFSRLAQIPFGVNLRDVGVAVTEGYLSRLKSELATDLGRRRMA